MTFERGQTRGSRSNKGGKGAGGMEFDMTGTLDGAGEAQVECAKGGTGEFSVVFSAHCSKMPSRAGADISYRGLCVEQKTNQKR